ncbi:MAG: hypothetical protein ACFCU8_15925 [Thermosynechococcaceae cyanobacterium]
MLNNKIKYLIAFTILFLILFPENAYSSTVNNHKNSFIPKVIVKNFRDGSKLFSQSSLASLPNANYRFCETRPSKDLGYDNCFSFRKNGNSIIGIYSQGIGEDNYCFSGTISGGVAVGESIISYGAAIGFPQSGTNLGSRGDFIDLLNPLVINKKYEPLYQDYSGTIKYRNTTIYLSRMYRWNAGSYVPPKNCSSSLL